MITFASDNHGGVHPAVLAALEAANKTPWAEPYGGDPLTGATVGLVRDLLGAPADVALVGSGTAANVLCLDALLDRGQSVICADSAHLHTSEGGAPERYLGAKILAASTGHDGKLKPRQISRLADAGRSGRTPSAGAVSVTQPTELGACYTLAEIRELAETAHAHGLRLHVDGARLANAAVTLNADLADLTSRAGADAVSIGLTKNGGMNADIAAVLASGRPSLRVLQKQALQQASKMRYLAAQAKALLGSSLWRENAALANAMATRLAEGLATVSGVSIRRPVESNVVFAAIGPGLRSALEREFRFYLWNPTSDEVRLMCAWDTSPGDVDCFVDAVASHRPPA